MTDFAQLKVGQIREAVLKKDPNFIDRDVVGKSAWVKTAQDMGLTPDDIVCEEVQEEKPMLDELKIFEEALEEAEIEEDTIPEPEEEKDRDPNLFPKYTDVGWHEYVMSKFHESELDRGYPKVEGMRRLAEQLLGEIVFSGPVSYQSSMPSEGSDPGRSVVNYEVRILWKNGVEPYARIGLTEYTERTFRGLAGCYPGNVKGNVFVVFPESIAETRAEARALRKALGLKVIAAEEFGDVEVKNSIISDKIQDAQIFFIKNKIQEHELNLTTILNEFGLMKLEDADRELGANIIKRINKLMKDKE
jgi:hypothetical protein